MAFSGRWVGRRGPFDWPARSPDLSSCDSFLWGYLKDALFKEPCTSTMQLQNRVQEPCAEITKARKLCHSVAQRLRDRKRYNFFLLIFCIMNTFN